MARTKQTARKSTGGKAPRKRLASKSCCRRVVYHDPVPSQRRTKKWQSEREKTCQPRSLPKKRSRVSESPEPRSETSDSDSDEESGEESDEESSDMVWSCRQTSLMKRRKEACNEEEESQPVELPHTRGLRLSDTLSPYATRSRTRFESGTMAVPGITPDLVDEEPSGSMSQADMNGKGCMLLEKLPLELRRDMIFSQVLGTDATFHLISCVRRVAHFRCPEASRSQHKLSCKCSTDVGYLSSSRNTADKTRRIELSLVQTCRQAYREGMHLLYSRPVFEVGHPETLNWFARRVRPQRLAAITKLNISLGEARVDSLTPKTQKHPFRVKEPKMRFARNDGDLLRYWDPAWRTIICDMAGLRQLTVTLIGVQYDDHEYAEPVLKPLLELRGLTTFCIRLKGESHYGNEAARLEHLKENSGTLRTILQDAIKEGSDKKRKAEDLNWGPSVREKSQKKKRKY